LISSKSSSST